MGKNGFSHCVRLCVRVLVCASVCLCVCAHRRSRCSFLRVASLLVRSTMRNKGDFLADCSNLQWPALHNCAFCCLVLVQLAIVGRTSEQKARMTTSKNVHCVRAKLGQLQFAKSSSCFEPAVCKTLHSLSLPDKRKRRHRQLGDAKPCDLGHSSCLSSAICERLAISPLLLFV